MNKKLLSIIIFLLLLFSIGLSVSFADSYKVTLQVEPQAGGEVEGGGAYQAGENAHLVATPNEGYVFVGWYREDGNTLVTNENDFYYDLEASRTYVARFEKSIAIGVIAEPAEGGSVTQSRSGDYILDEEATLTAASNDGYSFLGWFDASNPTNPLSTDSTYTFVVGQPMSFIARFAQEFQLDVNVTPEDAGIIEGTGVYAEGAIVMLEATPKDDYRFIGWYSPAAPDEVLTKDAQYTFNMNSDLTITAKFGRSFAYIGKRIALIVVIAAGAFIGLLFLIRYLQTIRRTPRDGPPRNNTARRSNIKTKPDHKKWSSRMKREKKE